MKKLLILLLTFITTSSFAQYVAKENFDKGWKFTYDGADPNKTVRGAEVSSFDDTKWQSVNLPHDWAIEGPFDIKWDCRMGALPVHGTGWYRKTFKLGAENRGKIIRIELEGAMSHATLWINGKEIGYRPYGYIGYEYDITKALKFDGSDNTVAIRLEPKDYSSRWYPGAGLYRSVWLKIDEPLYIDMDGVYVTTPTVTKAKAVVQNETTIVNKTNKIKDVEVTQEYFAPDGKKVATTLDRLTVEPKSKSVSGVFTNIANPDIWDLDTPNLYNVLTTIKCNGVVTDTYKTRFGIRSINYDRNGFYLNDKLVRFNGVCLHHDNGALGAAVYRRADERKLEILKEMGVNAIRTSHNPPSRVFLELCDEMGLLVLNEAFDCWRIPKVENGYNRDFEKWYKRDLTSFILRDRNHPSVIMWSVGNEILEQARIDGWRLAKELNDICKSVDPTRPTTNGFNNYSGPYDNNMVQQFDIVGVNYKAVKYSEIRANYPQLAFYGSETASTYSSRGIYHLPVEDYIKHPSKQVTSYDFVAPRWGSAPDFEFFYQKQEPYVMGEFVWTGFDYLGETSPYGGLDNIDNFSGHWNSDYPSRSSYFGIVDLAGFPKDRYYLYQSNWNKNIDVLHLLPHWNWSGKEGEKIPVQCYTNCEEVELFLNGKSYGRKVLGKDLTRILIDVLRYEPKHFDTPYRLAWEVPYEAGELKAVGYKGGEKVMEEIIRTAGRPAKVVLSVDRDTISADGRDLSYITAKIVDKDGNFCATADNRVVFSVIGDGTLIGTDNGDPTSTESFGSSSRNVFSGLALAIIRSSEKNGTIKLKVSSKGLSGAETQITVKKETH